MIKSGVSSKIGFEKTYLIDTRNPKEKDYGNRIPAMNFAVDIFNKLTTNQHNGEVIIPTDNSAVVAIATNSDSDAGIFAALQKVIGATKSDDSKRILANISQNLVDSLTWKN